MSTYDFTPENQKRFEYELVGRRLLELDKNPIKGKFDQAHLKEINRYLFQDMPKLGPEWADAYKGGKFRYPSFPNQDWIKCRRIESNQVNSIIAYSHMDDNALQLLNNVLSEADPQELAKLDQKDFTQKISDIYVKLDYTHPFYDGNSRTLREFTRCLANEAGFDLDWSKTNENQISRDKLYIARDISVYEIAKDKIQSKDNFRDVTYSYDILCQNPKLEYILKNCITKTKAPERALSKNQQHQEDDVQKNKILNKVLESERTEKALSATQQYNSSLNKYLMTENVKQQQYLAKIDNLDKSIHAKQNVIKTYNSYKKPGIFSSKARSQAWKVRCENLTKAEKELRQLESELKSEKEKEKEILRSKDVLEKEFRKLNPALRDARDKEYRQHEKEETRRREIKQQEQEKKRKQDKENEDKKKRNGGRTRKI